MNGYGFYKIYQPLNFHFTSSYDVLKYGGKCRNINIESYNKRTDRTVFEKWSNHFQSDKKAGQFCISNFVYNEHDWIYQAYAQAEETFIKWKSLREAQLHHLKNDLNVLSETLERVEFKSLFRKTPKGNKPPLLQLLFAGHISKEFVCWSNAIINFLDKWGEDYEIDPLISDQIFLLKKYQPFVVNVANKDEISSLLKAEFKKANEK